VRDVLDLVARVARPHAELPWEQRIGGLIRRQVRGDVKDAHRSVVGRARHTPAAQ
jgi:hypothetical protein